MFKTLTTVFFVAMISSPVLATECYGDKYTKENVVEAIHNVLENYDHLVFDETKEFPCVHVGDDVDKNMFLETYGFVPKFVVNHYHWKRNIIFLMEDAEYDSLVHEMTHYVQVVYQDYDQNSGSMDYLEEEAIRIQNIYRE